MNDTTLLPKKPTYGDPSPFVMHRARVPCSEAVLAMNLIERWGMISAVEDGEDSAGRQRGRLQEPKEVVRRACEMAKLAFVIFESNGWMTPVPSPEPTDD